MVHAKKHDQPKADTTYQSQAARIGMQPGLLMHVTRTAP